MHPLGAFLMDNNKRKGGSMYKKATGLIIVLCLFLSINASATSYEYAGVFSEHREVWPAFGGYSWYIMQAAALVNYSFYFFISSFSG